MVMYGMAEKGDGGGSNEKSLGRQGRVSAEARGASGYRVMRRRHYAVQYVK